MDMDKVWIGMAEKLGCSGTKADATDEPADKILSWWGRAGVAGALVRDGSGVEWLATTGGEAVKDGWLRTGNDDWTECERLHHDGLSVTAGSWERGGAARAVMERELLKEAAGW